MASEKEIEATPKTVRAGVYQYEIGYDGQQSYDFGYMGVCLNRSRRIMLDPRQPDSQIRQTLMHEILHAVGDSFEIPAVGTHTTDSTTHQVNDKIDLLASALLMFLRDNPAVVAWLQRLC